MIVVRVLQHYRTGHPIIESRGRFRAVDDVQFPIETRRGGAC